MYASPNSAVDVKAMGPAGFCGSMLDSGVRFHRAFQDAKELSRTFKSSGLRLVPGRFGAERQS